jgi:hypothetical protein
MLVFGPKECLLSKPKTTGVLVRKIRNSRWWNKKIQELEWPENSVCSLFCTSQTINFDEPFLVLIP